MALINKLSAIGNAIREKTGKADLLTLDQMPQEISSIETGGDTTMEDYIVSNTAIDTYTNNRITEVGDFKFRQGLIRVFNSTSLKTLRSQSFYSSTIEECNTPNVTSLSSGSTFASCVKLKRVHFPKIGNSLAANTFSGCTSLTYAHIGKISSIAGRTFENCKDLKTVIITSTSVPTLNSTNVFASSGIATGTGYVYVSDDLVEKYKGATNWSTYADQIKGISELPEEEV